ncbi:MAG TPA: helix-turn-helix transcriptional regulator [Gemmataceae bacterium]|nr:helix-turn-helix transcriptional regulator [Gemmataceae bacterium]
MAKKSDTFAGRLTALREAAGISQYRLAQLSGITKQTISNLERGETSPSWETVQLLAKALGVSCEEFVVEDIQPPEPPPVKRPGPKGPRKPKGK